MRMAFWIVLTLAVLGGIGVLVVRRLVENEAAGATKKNLVTVQSVEVASSTVGAMRDLAFFTGTLEAPRRFTISTKISGRVLSLLKDVGDVVRRGELVAVLEDDEYQQAVLQAEAELAVQTANVNLAAAELAVAERDLVREKELHTRGVSAFATFDRVEVAAKAKEALLRVAESLLAKSNAELELARTRRAYTRIHAEWDGDDEVRYVGERTANVGDTLRAHDVICTIIHLDKLTAVIHVTERDYAKLHIGSPVTLWTDAWPGRRFAGKVERVPPELREASREARVEVAVPNADHALKPGMFVSTVIEFGRKERAAIVPFNAPTRYNGADGLFVAEASVGPEGEQVWKARFVKASWGYRERPVRGGDGIGRLEVVDPANFAGLVVTLGQRLLSDGALIRFDAPATGLPSAEPPGAPEAVRDTAAVPIPETDQTAK